MTSSIAHPALLAVLLGCSAPAQLSDLQEAEDLEKSGQTARALEAYERALVACNKLRSPRKRRDACAAAHLQRAELLVSQGRRSEAIAAYLVAEKQLADHAPAAAQACYNAGRLYLELGDDARAYSFLWKSVTHYPDEAFAADALKRVVADGRARAPAQLVHELQKLTVALADTGIADNLLYHLADLHETEAEDPRTALQHYDLLAERYRQSGFYDDSLWHGARLSRALGDAEGAVRRLETLLATREVALGAGSYFSIWLDNAQLELGIVLRDDLHRHAEATAAFSRLAEDYPASVLKDDALFERAATKRAAGDTAGACADAAQLAKTYPDSKYELEKAPKLRSELSCSL